MATNQRDVYHADVVAVEKNLGEFGCRARVVAGCVGQCQAEGFVRCEWRTIQSRPQGPCLQKISMFLAYY
jgi:hypothetical protein